MGSLLRLFVVLGALISVGIDAVPQRCAQAERWSIQGRPFVEEYKGRVLVLTFMRLDCPTCEESVRSLNEFIKSEAIPNKFQHDVKIVIVVPHNELDAHIRSLQARYNMIRLVKESQKEPLWGWLRVGHNDALLYDRCGRLARHIRLPQIDMSRSRAPFEAIKSVINGQPCGACAFDRRQPQPAKPQITAYVRQSVPQTTIPPKTEELAITQAHRHQESFNSKDWISVPSISSSSRNRQQLIKQQAAIPAASEPLYPDDNEVPTPTVSTNGNGNANGDGIPKNADPEYYDYIAEFGTTQSPQNVQIPKPTMASSLWPTKSPVNSDKFNPTCAGYTDEICFNQFAQLSKSEVHKCCRSRISLTDQCQPGKCSNATQQLCCIQKFLQAKLSCCNDVSQTLPTGSTDKFSRCCYENFITENDECCPKTYASTQWKAVHELCLPNVVIDLSNIRVKTVVPGTSVATDFDFRYHRRWEFECKYGAHVSQYSYFGVTEAPTVAP
uniref:SelP_N domain-containing protein n=1 Tax=Panagrellus redivivus TaxID=6233 RepID=A0A7E4UMF3_PANRE